MILNGKVLIPDMDGIYHYTMTYATPDVIVKFSSLADASSWNRLQYQINQAENGATITLTENAVAAYEDIFLRITAEKSITLDLAGHTIDRGRKHSSHATDGHVIPYGRASSRKKKSAPAQHRHAVRPGLNPCVA